jgi:hypothetical protein
MGNNYFPDQNAPPPYLTSLPKKQKTPLNKAPIFVASYPKDVIAPIVLLIFLACLLRFSFYKARSICTSRKSSEYCILAHKSLILPSSRPCSKIFVPALQGCCWSFSLWSFENQGIPFRPCGAGPVKGKRRGNEEVFRQKQFSTST